MVFLDDYLAIIGKPHVPLIKKASALHGDIAYLDPQTGTS